MAFSLHAFAYGPRVFIWSDSRERDILRFIFVNHTWKAGLFFIQYSFTFKFKSCAHMTCMVVVVNVGTCYMYVYNMCIGRVWVVGCTWYVFVVPIYIYIYSSSIWLTCPMDDVFRILWAMNETRVTCSEPQLYELYMCVYVYVRWQLIITFCVNLKYIIHAFIPTQFVQAYIHY